MEAPWAQESAARTVQRQEVAGSWGDVDSCCCPFLSDYPL